MKRSWVHFLSELIQYLRKWTIRKRIVGSLLLVSVFPIALVGIYSSSRYRQSVVDKLSSYSGQIVQETAQNVAGEANQYEKLSETLMVDKDVINDLLGYSSMSYSQKNSMYHSLSDKFSVMLFNYRNVQDISIWVDQNTPLYDMGYLNFGTDAIQKIMQETDKQTFNTYWTYLKVGSGRNCIVLCRQIYSDYHYDRIGYVMIFLDEKIFADDTYKDIDLGTGSDLSVLQSNGMIISTNSSDLQKGQTVSDKTLIPRLQSNYECNLHTFQVGHAYLYAGAYIPSLDWYVVGKIPYRYISSQTAGVQNAILILCGFVILFSLALSVMVYMSIYSPLRRLLRYAGTVSEGNLDGSLHDRSNDELGVLTQSIARMVGRIRCLMDEAVAQQAQKRKVELQMLQAQINPHFLFNTLNSLRWSAMLSGNHTLEGGIGALSGLLQNTILNSDEYITVKDEIENVRNYAVIQKIRYADSFTLQVEMQKEAEEARILKFILQPIVENSILHGGGDDERIVHIHLSVRVEDDVLAVTIRDDGKGFDMEKQETRARNGRLSGIGIGNVDERIRLNFGAAFGLHMESTPGKGTVTRLKCPLFYEKGEE